MAIQKDSVRKRKTVEPYGVLERKIACCLTRLPSEHLLALVKTKEQTRSWLVQRVFQSWVSLCWRARHTGENDPLASLLRSGNIDLVSYNRVWALVDFWEQLWGLVQLAEPCIREEFERLGLEYSFDSAYELFVRILWEDANHDFSVCLKPYFEVSQLKYEKAYRLASKGCSESLNPIQERRLHGLLNQHQPVVLLQLVLAVCHLKATRRRTALKSKLKLFYVALSNLCDSEATAARKADSFAWKDGAKMQGTQRGTYVKKPETL